jgi:hypothetical protein
MHARVTHVICAADLQTAEHVYFSARFVNAWRVGWGTPGDLRLSRAVQASAALPGAFNSVTLPVRRHRFPGTPELRSFRLTDGGVYDNMGTEWPIRLGRRLREGSPPSAPPADADELIVVNASAGLGVVKRKSLRTPVVGEITSLLAVKDVLYDQTTAVRRRLLDLRFRAARGGLGVPEGPLNGALVQIDRSPYDLPDAFARGDDELALRARAALEVLGPNQREAWEEEAKANQGVKTRLSKIPRTRAVSLIRHAYVLTMVSSHVLLGYELLAVPDDARFRELLS